MKKLLFIFGFFVLASNVYPQDVSNSFTLNFKGGLLTTGPGKPNIAGYELNLKASPLFKADLDGILVPKLSMGLYFIATPMKVEEFDETSNFMSVGLTIKPRFTLQSGMQIRPGLAIGYNKITGSALEDPSSGLDVGFQIEVSKKINDKLGVVGEIGFISQPVGGDGIIDITFPPVIYLCIGIEFGK